jgi:hypothetical protein
MAKGKHRAEDQPDGLSTSERFRGKGSSDRASQSKHRLPGEDTQVIRAAGSDLPSRDGSKGPGTRG